MQSQEAQNVFNTRTLHFDAPPPKPKREPGEEEWFARVHANGEKFRLEEEAKRAGKRVRLDKYGLTQGDFDCMVAVQGGKCAICDASDAKLVVDHSHSNGRVRELLCAGCNSGLGFFKENIEALKCAIVYLEQHARKDDNIDGLRGISERRKPFDLNPRFRKSGNVSLTR